MYNIIMHSKLLTIQAKRKDIPEHILRSIVNWEVLGKARKESPLKLKIFITKWVSGDTATGKVMVQRKQRLHSNCPMCNNVDKTTTHILQCLEEKICTLKIKLITDLGTWLDTVDTQDQLKTFICDRLAS